VNIAHARQKNLQGQNLINYTDSRGKFVVRELSALAQAGGGYLEYYWIKPGETGEKKKLGYVEPIPNTDYFIGTGVYLE
jgi:signal transduction histidine kinase